MLPCLIILPVVGSKQPDNNFKKVDFPDPLGPDKPILSPSEIEIVIFLRAFT